MPKPAATLVFEIQGSGRVHTVGVFIDPCAGGGYEAGRKWVGVPACVLRSISGVSEGNRPPCACGGSDGDGAQYAHRDIKEKGPET
jgi:hypothetical protein